MSNDEKYNGWTNRETWAVNLNLENDQGLYEETTQRLKAAQTEADDSIGGDANYGLAAEALKTWVTDELLSPAYYREELGAAGLPESLEGMRSDVGSLWRVDWYEIAKNWLEGLEE